MEIKELKEKLKLIENLGFIDFKKAPKTIGVYLLRKEGKLVYIGSSLNLKRRLRGLFSNNPTQHILNKRVPREYYRNCSIKILEVDNIRDAKALEYFLIAKFNPPLNK